MSSDDFELNQNNNEKISVKKSTFNGLIIGLIVAVGVAAFFAGSYTSNLNSNQISEEDLSDADCQIRTQNVTKSITYRTTKTPNENFSR